MTYIIKKLTCYFFFFALAMTLMFGVNPSPDIKNSKGSQLAHWISGFF